MLAILIFILGLAVSALLIFSGVRGYRVGDHPVCRVCGFDLFGLPATQAVCPECGGSLSNGVFIGHKHRRKWLIVVGVLLLLLPLTIAAILTANINYEHYAPLWWLKREAMSMITRNAAVDEVNLRLKNLALSQAQINDFADFALAQQANMKITWLPEFGDFVERARSLNKLDDARWRRYAMQAYQPPQLVVRKKIRRGDVIPYSLVEIPPRAGKSCPLWIQKRIDDEARAGSDLVLPHESGGSITFGGGMMSSGASFSELSLSPKLMNKAAEGKYVLRLAPKISIFESYHDSESGKPLATLAPHLEASWQLVSRDAQTVKLIHDDSLKEKMAARLKANELKQWQSGGDHFDLTINISSSLPAPVAFSVIIKSGEKTWKMGQVHFTPTDGISGYGTGGELKGLTADKADVILRSDPDAALDSVDMDEMWVGEVVIKDVPVKRAAKSSTAGK